MSNLESNNIHNRIHKVAIDPAEVEHYGGVRVELPRNYLQGTQDYGQYSDKKMRRIDKKLAENGIDFLRHFPAIGCGLDNRAGLDVVLIDAHHRVRRAGNFNLPVIPTLVLPLDAVVDLVSTQFGYRYSLEEVRECLYGEIAEATDSFIKIGVEYKGNKCLFGSTVQGVHCVSELAARYGTF